MGRYIADYGGNSYNSPHYLKRKKATRSFYCNRCGHLNYIMYRELNRRFRPGCSACGSKSLRESTASERRSLEKKKEIKRDPAPYLCWSCGCALHEPKALQMHLLNRGECRSDFIKDGFVTGPWLMGTYWSNLALNVSGKVEEVPEDFGKKLNEAYVKKLNKGTT